MEDPLGSYPLAIRQQGALFERNPVCALAYRVCMDMCEEYGGLHFNLMDSIEVADEVCLHLVRHAWQPPCIEQYYHWIQGRLDNNHAAVMCACATVSVSVSVMADAPEPLRELGRNMRGLVYGDGNRILENLRSAVYQQDITLSADAYGEMPAMPLALRERMELEQENDKLVRQVIASKRKLKEMEAKQYQQYNAPVYQGCTFNDSHDTHYHYGAQPASPHPSTEGKGEGTEQTDTRYKKLFCNAFGDEDTQRTNEEKQRVQRYIADHNLGNRQLDSARDNPLNRIAVCFCAKWLSLRYIGQPVSATALLRFLSDDCEIELATEPKPIANVLAKMLKADKDKEIFYDVCEYF
ncbi:MAG: hypothetical protein II605_01375 [Paludibacteraceae bacterium]|nr:hypothetical protein [Paludibacteraceae bacterium]MBQ2189707.1 hypothetical protein [Paludibacteraceae bacterium]MBQ2520174.1 hypothetical protein [Paludibacteraceae bacterium]MBQ4017873.1 hypothetical protein [Paludibacteraceae bacterium]